MSEHIKVELDFIPVEERLPEPSATKRLLVLREDGNVLDASFWGGVFLSAGAHKAWPVTHWAEIPEMK
jgi:hypothetical protein